MYIVKGLGESTCRLRCRAKHVRVEAVGGGCKCIQHFAAQGKKVLLVLQSEDQNGEKLLDLTLLQGSSPRNIETNLDVLRAYSTTLLEEPWKGLRETEAQLSFSGGILDEVIPFRVSQTRTASTPLSP